MQGANPCLRTMKKIYDKDISEMGLDWVRFQEKKFDKTPIGKIDEGFYYHVDDLKEVFTKSLRFHASL